MTNNYRLFEIDPIIDDEYLDEGEDDEITMSTEAKRNQTTNTRPEEIKVYLDKDIKNKFDNIFEAKVRDVEHRLNKIFTKDERKSIKQKSLDLVDACIRSVSKNQLVSIYDLDVITLNKYKKMEDEKIALQRTTHRKIEFEPEKAEEFINEMILENFETAVLYCCLGHNTQKRW